MQDISGLFKEDRKQKRVHFIRSGVGVGKSTMARYLSVSDKFDNKFVIIEGTGGIECWKTWIIRAYKIEKSKQDVETPQSLEKIDLELASLEDEKKSIYLSAALDWFRDKHKVLIFDEAHKTFSQTELVSTLYHDPSINILLFSASSEVEGDQNKIVETPKEITEIYLWRPKVVIDDDVILDLHQAETYLDRQALLFILELCGEHFGIVLYALDWIRKKQCDSNSQEIWDYSTTVKEVRKSIRLGWDKPNSLLNFVKQSRAIKVNGGSEPTEKSFYPDVFAEILFKGPRAIRPENRTARKVLTVHGMIFPIRKTNDTTSLFRYRDQDVVFGVPHPLMCTYYQREFKKYNWKPFIQEQYSQPQDCADLLARVIPYLSFLSVVSAPITSYASAQTKDSTMSNKHNFPHEDQFQLAILKHLWKLGFETLMVMSNNDKIGRPDIVVPSGTGTFVLELLLATRDDAAHKEHISRFRTKTNYAAGTEKCIVTIGKDASRVQRKMDLLNAIKIDAAELVDVEVLGLVPTKAFCSYTFYKLASRKSMQEFHFPVDGVSRSIGKMAGGHDPVPVVDVISLIPRAKYDKKVFQLKTQIETLESVIKAGQLRGTRLVVFCLHKGLPSASTHTHTHTHNCHSPYIHLPTPTPQRKRQTTPITTPMPANSHRSHAITHTHTHTHTHRNLSPASASASGVTLECKVQNADHANSSD